MGPHDLVGILSEAHRGSEQRHFNHKKEVATGCFSLISDSLCGSHLESADTW